MSDPSSPSFSDQLPEGSFTHKVQLKRKTPQENLLRTIIGVLVGLGFGGVMAYVGLRDALPGISSLSWSKTQGVIKSRDVEHALDNRGGKQFSIHVVYTYTVDGKQYENSRIQFPETWDSGDEAYEKKQADVYRPGSKKTVYYDPGNPAQSCLIQGPRYFFVGLFGGLSALSLLIGMVCLLSLPSALKRLATG